MNPRLVGLAVAFVGSIILWWSAGAAGIGAADPTDSAQVAAGETTYYDHCAVCHGPALEGQPNWRTRMADGRLPAPPHDESGHTWHHPDAVLFELTKYGLKSFAGPDYVTDMPVYDGELTDAEIWAVLAFIKSRWPDEILARQEKINRRHQAQ